LGCKRPQTTTSFPFQIIWGIIWQQTCPPGLLGKAIRDNSLREIGDSRAAPFGSGGSSVRLPSPGNGSVHMDLPNDSNPPNHPATDRRRLNSWKSIGAYFERDERTVKRWEAQRGLPVYRIPGGGRSGVYAYTSELAEWLKTADTQAPPALDHDSASDPATLSAAPTNSKTDSPRTHWHRSRIVGVLVGALLVSAIAGIAFYRKSVVSRPASVHASPVGVKPSINPEAQELYLQGRYHWNKRTPEGLHQAVDDFTQSIVRDPNYAPAYAGLANCYNLLREYTLMPAKEAYPRALAAARRAVALDDSLAEAHSALAFVDFYWSWDVPNAEREFRRAIALDPNSVVAHHWYATFLMVLGRSQEALSEIEEARKLDPPSSSILADKGLILFLAGQTNQAIVLLKQIESAEPSFLSPHAYLATVHLATKEYKKFLVELKTAAIILHDQGRLRIVAAGEKGFAASGGPGMLHSMLNVQQDLYEKGNFEAYELASTYCLLGNKKRALSLLQIAVERREAGDVAIRVDQNLQSLHDNPIFRRLVEQVGLPQLS
jgi:Tfp pilus assembly protein PilF